MPPIPTHPPGRSFIAAISVVSVREAKFSVEERSDFPGKLLTNDSVGCLEDFQLQHILTTYANARFRFDLGDLISEKFILVFGYLRHLILHFRALEIWSPSMDQQQRRVAKVYPSFPGQPLPGRVGRPLSAEQFQHVKEVFSELIGQKHEIRESEESAYSYLLGCMEQLIHHIRGQEAEMVMEGEL